ncbi:hypothetical protein LTR62_005715 [Meristemomyces frigidus]|uniref:2,5-diamino-6-ribosylamino-4(3H)-pyrimidinone 5'-phosphate reductase n=1 Tax=Meristemomyces frigidus TaxID=1508187 RepID=A0AAN7TCE3_9PEZI|nr:hypothetical protein LTR62_005715 [Meristemomyces frigidus]
MSKVTVLSVDDIAFLEPYLPRSKDELPFVTLTYASSLDGMISLAPGLRTTLSGSATKSMTHYLRQYHDAILVGVGTVIADDPSLNCRYPGADFEPQPRPIVVDPRARWDYESSKLVQLSLQGKGKKPLLVHVAHGVERKNQDDGVCEHAYLPAEGEGPDSNSSSLDWMSMLMEFKRRGMDSVMIEGGATIISALLRRPELIDSVIVTLAPTWLGAGGVTVQPAERHEGGERVNAARLMGTAWRQFGDDAVLCGRLGT